MAVYNNLFGYPDVGTDGYQYSPATSGDVHWTFEGYSGITSGGSTIYDFGFASTPPKGPQAGFIQGATASISQTLYGLTIGQTYEVRFDSAYRYLYSANTVDVQVDGTSIGSVTPGADWMEYVVSFTASATSITLAFVGLGGDGDCTSYVHDVWVCEGPLVSSSSALSSASSSSDSSMSSSTGSGEELDKITQKYGAGVHVIVPSYAEEVRTAFKEIRSKPWCMGVSLTGSGVFEGFDPRDVDVAVWVNPVRWAEALADRKTITLPRTIAGKRLEVFWRRFGDWSPHLYLHLGEDGTYTLTAPDTYKLLSVAEGIRPRIEVPKPPRIAYGSPTPQAVRPAPLLPAGEWAAKGPEMWAELHRKVQPDTSWLNMFLARIPCGSCRVHALQWVNENPAEFGQGWLAWTVRFHNAVNERLGKPQMMVSQARERWFSQS